MLLISRLAKKLQSLRDEYQIKEQAKAREIQRNLQRETQDSQQTHALLVALHELQRKMDPLIAAQVYNNRICPFSRLPEELLLGILDFLYDDPVTLQCIRIVSRTFLRLLDQQSAAWSDKWYPIPIIHTKGNPCNLRYPIRLQLRCLLQRDGRCDKCKHWNDVHKKQLYDTCKFRQNGHQSPIGLPNPESHCHACNSWHDELHFSADDLQPWTMQAKRQCLGQQGSVELCEHVQVYWSSIKAHIDNWRQEQHESGDWRACLDSFKIECQDAIHDTRCTTLEPPTWPRARLGTGAFNSGIVVLYLEWLPHNRIDALNLTADGRIPVTGLRTMFQQVRRRGPADILCPPCRPDAPPEMALFGPSSHAGSLISYNTGEEDEAATPPPTAAVPRILWESALQWYRGRPTGANGTKLEIKPHFPSDANDSSISSVCLVATYQKDIMVCKTADITDTSVPIVPTHHWLHAMDIRTYPHPKGDKIRPPCMDLSCVNYYRGRGEYYNCPPYS